MRAIFALPGTTGATVFRRAALGAARRLDTAAPAAIITLTMSTTVGTAGFVFTRSKGAGRDGV